MIENRRSYRLPFRAKVVFGDGRRTFAGNTINISAGGLYIMSLGPSFARNTRCQTVFMIDPKDDPIVAESEIKRVVSRSDNLEETPGVGIGFAENSGGVLERINDYLLRTRRNFEILAAILSSGEPELASLDPLIRQMHLPSYTDLGHLRFLTERILKSMEMIDESNRSSTSV